MDRRNILIDYEKKDIEACSFGLPWDHDAICYNFDFPTECVLASEIDTLINDKSITGIVIGHDLEDYSFLKSLSELSHLYFYNTKELKDLSFLENQYKLRQLYISESKIKDLNNLVDFLKRKEIYLRELESRDRVFHMTEGICINSDNKLDGSLLKTNDFYISEIIVNSKHFRR